MATGTEGFVFMLYNISP